MKRENRAARVVVTLSCLAISLLFVGYEAGIASAQVLYGSIVGTVTDQANAVVPKTAVTVKNTSTGLSRQVNTDENGYYSMTNLPEGAYDLSVSAAGFRPLIQQGVNVLINNFLDGRNACYLAYSRTAGVLYLVPDSGNGLLPGLVLNSSGTFGRSRM